MKVIAYLLFTLLSILLQFCVMDYIQGIQNDDIDKLKDLNGTSQKKHFIDILKDFEKKPHALYYRTANNKLFERNIEPINKYTNTSMPEISLEISTETSTLEFLYDENSSVTEDTFTTEFSTIDPDNVTEITLFENKNATTAKPETKLPKRKASKDCDCNLLYEVCDTNCCCDNDCSEKERQLFLICNKDHTERASDPDANFCIPHHSYYDPKENADSLFCIAKTNLPEKRVVNRVVKHDESVMNRHYKWLSKNRIQNAPNLERKLYERGDIMWQINNQSYSYVDIPIPLVNSYCSDRRPILFLKDEKIKCTVKLSDLESLYILTNLQETSILSFTEKSLNSSSLNCSNLHCTNWTILICDEETCTTYNSSLHDPKCTENVCTNIAQRMDYIFYYHDSKIINASIKLFSKNISHGLLFITQEISVNFILANISIDSIVQLSGNPGYLSSLPLIVSYTENNHSELFFKNTIKWNKYLPYPSNDRGRCKLLKNTENYVRFGINKRIKCQYMPVLDLKNDTDVCGALQKNINNLFGLNRNVVVSPFGNPQDIKDEEWLQLQASKSEIPIYGELNKEMARLHCFNLVTRLAYIFSYADSSLVDNKSNMKLLSAKIDATTVTNISFAIEDISVVVTIDTTFIDETKPSVFQYAGAPHLNIRLPGDFFFPFPSNESIIIKFNVYLIVYLNIIAFLLSSTCT